MAFVVKLLVIFFGSGFVTLFAFWIARQTSEVPKLILGLYQNQNKKLKVNKETKISSGSGIYELSFQDKKITEVFSSNMGMKILN